ncbi:MAG: PAS domain S-box protein, partial [Promethearchaeota archaeon]
MVVEYINISEKYNSLMEALNRVGIGIDIVSKDHKILYQNQTLKKKFGDCVGRSCYEKYMNLRQPCEFCPMERAIKNNVVESLELTGADGRDYELFSAPLPNPDGMIDRVAEVIIDITERKNAEKQLKYKDHIINSTSNIIATCDLDGIMNFVNPAFLEIWGYENVSEVYGKHFKQFWNVEENLEEIINTLMTDHKWFGEVKATKKDGKLFDVQVSASLLVDDKCNPIGFMSSSMDITDRKLNEQRLIRSEEQFCKTFHESVVLMCITTIDEGKIIEVNNSFLKTFGFSREEVIGKTSRELDLLFDYEERDRKIKDVTKDSGIEIRDVRFKVKDGSVIYGLISLSQISLQDQSYLLTMITDITERKLAEHKIAESEEKFSKTFHESIVIMAISTIEEGKFLEVNDAFLKTLGFSKKEVIGKTSQELNIFLNFKERREIIKEVKEQKFAKNREMLIRKKDGTIIQGLFSVSQIMLQDRPYLLTMMNDITERKRAEQKLKESEEKFKIISEQNLMGILILQDNVIKYLNKAMGDMYGYSIEEVYNWKPNEFLKIIAPEFLEYVKEQAKKKQMGDSDQKSHYFLQGVKKNGEHIWIENFSKTIQYNNRPADLITQIDITEKRKFELDIRDSEEKYRTLFEGANDAIFLMKDYKFIECNKKTLEVFGYDDESEILGFFPWEISPLYQPDGKDSKITAIEYMDFALNGKPARFYWKHKRKDGNFMDAEVSLNRILIGKDKYIQAIVRDITEKIQAEKMLEESEKKYRLISENANDLISVLNNKYEYEYINEQAYVNILGYSENDLIGKNAWLNVHPEDREEFLKSRDLSENGFIARNGSDKEVLRIKHKQGHYVWIEYTSRIFVDDKGKPKVLL